MQRFLQVVATVISLDIQMIWSISCLFLILFLIKRLSFKQTTSKNLPPSPPKFPIIGNFHQLGFLPHQSLQSLSKRYGPLMLIHLGSMPTLIVSSADAACEIMKTHDLLFCDRPDLRLARKLLYDYKDVSVSPYGEYWRQLKSIMVLHLLSNKRVESFYAIREEEIANVINKISTCSGGNKGLDLSELFMMLTNDVISRVAFGRKYGEGESGKKTRRLLTEFLVTLGMLCIGDFIPLLSWVDWMTGLDGKIDRISKEIDEFLEGVVEERMKKQRRSTKGGEDFIDILLNIQNGDTTGIPLERVSIKALLLDAYSAGTDTTAAALEWAMTELLRNSHAMKKVQDEVRRILNGKEGMTEEDLAKMHYLKAVIKETLRIHPPIPMLVPRIATRDVKLMGYDIAKGTMVFINAWAIGRDPKIWHEPEEFQPERFLDSDIDFKGHDFELIPFGSGRRGCPGISFAMATIESALASLVYRFNWEVPDGGKGKDVDISEAPGTAVRKRSPLVAIATTYQI